MTAKKAGKPAPAPERPVAPPAQVAVCVIPGCEQPVLHRGLCPAHWEDPRLR